MTLLPMKRGGLFGAIPQIPTYNTPGTAPDRVGAFTPAQPQQPLSFLQGGKLTGKDALGLALAGIGDAFGRRGSNNVGMLIGQNMMARQQRDQMAQMEKMRQQQRMEGREDKQWEWQNRPVEGPDPTTFQRDYQYIMQTQGPQAAAKFMENKINPPVWRQGADGQFYRVDTAGGDLPPDTLPADFDFGGGSGGNAAGGFRP